MQFVVLLFCFDKNKLARNSLGVVAQKKASIHKVNQQKID